MCCTELESEITFLLGCMEIRLLAVAPIVAVLGGSCNSELLMHVSMLLQLKFGCVDCGSRISAEGGTDETIL